MLLIGRLDNIKLKISSGMNALLCFVLNRLYRLARHPVKVLFCCCDSIPCTLFLVNSERIETVKKPSNLISIGMIGNKIPDFSLFLE